MFFGDSNCFITHLLDTKPALDNLLVIVLLERVLFSEVLYSVDSTVPDKGLVAWVQIDLKCPSNIFLINIFLQEMAHFNPNSFWNNVLVQNKTVEKYSDVHSLVKPIESSPGQADPARRPLGRTVCWLENPRPAPFPLQQSSTRPGHLKSPCQPEQFVEFCLEMASMVESVPRNQH